MGIADKIAKLLSDPENWKDYEAVLPQQKITPVHDAGDLALIRIERLKEAVSQLAVEVEQLASRLPQNPLPPKSKDL